jgi:hypothetical protein
MLPTQMGTNRRLIHLGDSLNSVEILASSSGLAYFYSYNVSTTNFEDFTGNTQLTDGDIHESRITLSSNDAHFYVDGVENGTDTSCILISPNIGIHIGRLYAYGYQPENGLISNVRIYDRIVPP